MIARSRRMAGYFTALVAIMGMLVPSASHAAGPAISNLNVFGNVKPGDPGATDPVRGSKTVYANSLPYGANFTPGQAYVNGKLTGFTPDANGDVLAFVDVTVSDGANSRTVTVTAQPRNDAGMGTPNGEQGYFHAEVPVTDLGVHTVTNPTGTLAEQGITILSFTIAARSATTSETAQLPNTLSPAPIELAKYAGTPNDVYNPTTNRNSYPPENWCHLSSDGGIRFGSDSFGHLESDSLFGGNRNGACSSRAVPGVIAVPALTWVPCALAPDSMPGVYGPGDGFPPANGRKNVCPRSQAGSVPFGSAQVRGSINDQLGQNSYYIASEIGSILVEMRQGGQTVKSYSSEVPGQLHVSRLGHSASYSVDMKIADFEPNYPDGDPYQVRVTIKDAWGNTRTVSSGDITIYPW